MFLRIYYICGYKDLFEQGFMKTRKVLLVIYISIYSACSVIAQSGPGGVSSPLTNNIFWLRSDKGLTYDGSSNVTTWADQANTYDATNNNTPTNPLFDISANIGTNSEPAIRYTSASSEYLDLADDAAINTGGATERTIYFVFQTGTDVSTTQYLYQQGNTTDGIYATISGGVFTAGIYSTSVHHFISSAALSINTEYIVGLIYDGGSGTLDLSLNGTYATQVTSVAASIASHTGIRIGSDVANANFLDGHLAELIYFDAALNEGEARVIDNYLGEKFGITVVNDHYSAAGADYRYNLVGISQVNTENHDASNGLGGTIYLSENGADALSDDEHVFVGHNNSNQSTTSQDLTGISDTERYNRIWYLEKTGNLGAIIEFDVVESGLYTDVSGLTATDFSLLTRAGTSGDFTQTTMADNPTFNGNRIQFTLTDGELASGYYTLGSPASSKKWYVINSGNWSDAITWTLDPAGAIYSNPDGLTPDSSPTSLTDEVTVLSGKTVTVGIGDMSGTLTKLKVDGTLDFGSSTGHGTVSLLEGSGTIRLSDDILPTFTDASNFTDTGSGAGTVEYYGTNNVDLTSSSGLTSFYNLVVNLTGANTLAVTTDITVNGNLTITDGDFQINDNSATTRLVIDILGNLDVAANGEMSVGTGNIGVPTGINDYHDTFHRFNIKGNFTNNGIVNFSNLTGPNYSTFPTNGDAVTVRFYGESDNTLTCNNTTNFYSLYINKGSDKTYTLTVNSSAIENFRIFGKNDLGTPNATLGASSNPVYGKPLYLESGTLKLTGSIFIPSLSEGDGSDNGSWIIPSNAGLWIDGSNVTVWGTAENTASIEAIDTDLTGLITGVSTATDQEEGLLIYGEFRITDGVFDTRNGGSILYTAIGQTRIIVEGGTLELQQIRPFNNGSGGIPTYFQSGGTVNLYGETRLGADDLNVQVALFEFGEATSSFTMTGGQLICKDVGNDNTAATPNGINIGAVEGNFNVSGGNIIIDMDGSSRIDNNDGFEITCVPNIYNLEVTEDQGFFVQFLNDAQIINDLIISSAVDLQMNGNDLSVGRNFNIAAGATYTQGGNNTTSFNGDASQTITLEGSYGDFYDLVVSGSGLKTITSGDMTITNSLTIESGASIDNADQDIIIQGSLSNSGTHTSSGTGALEFSGGSTTYDVSGDDNGVFGDITLNDAANDVSFTADQSITGTLTFSQDQLLDINTSKLRMDGASASISGSTASRFIVTAGNASDGGLEWYLPVGTTNVIFPIGTDANATTRYTPLDADFTALTDDGYIQVTVADTEIPTAGSGAGAILSYYWRVRHSDFGSTQTVTNYAFTHVDSDEDGANTSSWRSGKVLDSSPYTRSNENNYTRASNLIEFDNGGSFDLEEANYSVGAAARFNNGGQPDIYYSRQDGNFNTASTWSKNDPTGGGTQEVPIAASVVIIQSDGAGDSHRVNTRAAINDLGAVVFDHDYATYPDAATEDLPRLQFLVPGTFNLGVVSGAGMISFDATDDPTVNGDFGDFGANTDSYYLYFNGPSTLTNIPTPIPNLMVESATYIIDQNITTNANVVVQGNGTIIPVQDMTISEDLRIGTWSGGTFQFPNSGTAVTVTINGNIDFTQDPYTNLLDRDLTVADAAVDLEHRLILKGDILHGTENGHSIDLYNADNARPRVILELQGESDNNYARTSTSTPDLYRIIQNKGSDQTYSFTFNDDFTVSTPTATIQPIELQNGTLVINDASIGDANDVVLTNETNDSDFNIPSTAGLQISAGTVTVLGDDLGITLDGSIILDGTGILDMDGGNNNFIEYSSSGSASINISGTAQLLVGSQIRESSSSSGGILRYTQSGGTVLIGTNTGGSPIATRSMFAVSGTGSLFDFTGGALTIANHLSNDNIASLYLDPASFNVGIGTTIQFGDASTITGFENLTLQTEISLYDVIVDNASVSMDYPPLSLLNTSLTLDNDLIIEANTTFDAAGLGLNIAGDFSNAGTFDSNSNTTIFNGSGTQTISGATTFYNLTKSGNNTVQLVADDLVVQNNLEITAGTLDDNNNNITVSGTVNNSAIHTNSNGTKSNSGIILSGTSAQDITGAGTFSRIEINNASDVSINEDVIITEQVRLNTGSLDIQGYQLTMNEDASFFDAGGGGFSSSKMVQTRRSFTDAGVIKLFNGTSASPFTYPIGSGDKYTPVVITLTQNSQTDAIIAVRAADEPHPNVQEDVDSPEFVDEDNVLQYYWEVTSSGMTDLLGNITFTYKGSDAYVTSPFSLDDYNIARLLPDDSDNWNKLATGFNYQSRDGSNTLSFDINSASNDAEIAGDYTAGVDGAIPNTVQTVTSNLMGGTGDWTTNASWDTNSEPRGAIVEILPGDEITMDDDNLLAYRTVINGTLIVDGAFSNQRLGRVSGSGTLVLSGNGTLPAGIYDDFFNCATGGTLAFNDDNDYTLPDEIANLRNLLINGAGTKSFPNVDITICNDLELQGGTTLNNDFNVDVEVLGNMTLTNGTLDIGSNTTFMVNGDVTIAAGTLDLGNSELIIMGNLILDGGTLALGTNGSIDLEGDLTIDGGTIAGANSCDFNFAGDITKTSGSFTVDATTNTFVADGVGTQSISGDFTGASAFNRLTINKSSGDLSILDGGNDVEIDGVLTLTSQNILTDATNTLTLTSTASISGGSTASYVEGPLTKNGIAASGNFTFPIGNSARFGYARLVNVGTGSQNWTAEYISTNANSGQTIDIATNAGFGAMVEISTINQWTITPSGTNSATVELGVVSGMGIDVIEDVRIAIYDGPTASEWVNLGGSPSGDESDGSVTSQTISDFSSSTFSFGGITTVALPVELISFNAELDDENVKITWATASELNNDYFELERSSDGIHYEFIGEVLGNGTINEITSYDFIDDQPYYGISYYRLAQVDYDGTRTVFKPVSINNDTFKKDIDVSVFPNPTYSSNVNLRISTGDENSSIRVMLFDLSSNLIYTQEISPNLGVSDYQLNIRGTLHSGIYLMNIQQGYNQQIQRLIIK